MDRDEMSNLYRGSSIDASYQMTSTNQKHELPVVAMSINGSGRNSNLYRGPSIDASYQISVHLAMQFQI